VTGSQNNNKKWQNGLRKQSFSLSLSVCVCVFL